MGERMRGFDWSRTPLGPVQGWPERLKTSAHLMLAADRPMFVCWGEDLIALCNDSCRPLIGKDAWSSLGRPVQSAWPALWNTLEPQLANAMRGTRVETKNAVSLFVEAEEGARESFFTITASPIAPAADGTGGVLCTALDESERVLFERRFDALHAMATRGHDAGSIEEVCDACIRGLESDAKDVPFALIYLYDAEHRGMTLEAACGIEAGHKAAPDYIPADDGDSWPIGGIWGRGRRRVISGLAARFGALPSGPWDHAPESAVIVPLPAAERVTRGVLIAGCNPYRPLDAAYGEFLDLVADRIGAALDGARLRMATQSEVEQARRADLRQKLLLDELNHRVKNTLATVQAIASQTLHGVEPTARDSFVSRLFALSSQHDLLSLANWEGTTLGDVVERSINPYRNEYRDRFIVEGPHVRLGPKRALALGMVFHELATNARNFGALSNQAGRVLVTWTVDDEKRMHLVWREEGGPRVEPPQRRGFGSRLISRGLAREIAGNVSHEFAPEGVVCRWTMTIT